MPWGNKAPPSWRPEGSRDPGSSWRRALAALQAASLGPPSTQGISLRPQPWARISRPFGPSTGTAGTAPCYRRRSSTTASVRTGPNKCLAPLLHPCYWSQVELDRGRLSLTAATPRDGERESNEQRQGRACAPAPSARGGSPWPKDRWIRAISSKTGSPLLGLATE
jgi:hypothetical protein